MYSHFCERTSIFLLITTLFNRFKLIEFRSCFLQNY
jgi:hypothetical protein